MEAGWRRRCTNSPPSLARFFGFRTLQGAAFRSAVGRTHREGSGKCYRFLPGLSTAHSIPRHLCPLAAFCRVQGTVQMDSRALQGVDALQMIQPLRLERLTDSDGSSHPPQKHSLLPPSSPLPGYQLNENPGGGMRGLSKNREIPLVKTTSSQAEARVDLTLTLPPDLPAGYYRPFLHFDFPGMPMENPPSPSSH